MERQPFDELVTVEVADERHVIGRELGRVLRARPGPLMSAASTQPVHDSGAWRYPRALPSLPESYHTIQVPKGVSFWRKASPLPDRVTWWPWDTWTRETGQPTWPAGRRFGYTLLSVVLLSNLMAILLQALALKLGIATGRDLAQACRDHYSRPVSFVLWVLCEIAIAACDLAEVIGSAIALNLLFGIPLVWGVCLTAFDVLFILLLQHKGFRYLEALVITLVATIGACFAARADHGAAGPLRCRPRPAAHSQIVTNPMMLYIAIGILGATVMPHNLYLHSSIVQTRKVLPRCRVQTRGDSFRHSWTPPWPCCSLSSSTPPF